MDTNMGFAARHGNTIMVTCALVGAGSAAAGAVMSFMDRTKQKEIDVLAGRVGGVEHRTARNEDAIAGVAATVKDLSVIVKDLGAFARTIGDATQKNLTAQQAGFSMVERQIAEARHTAAPVTA